MQSKTFRLFISSTFSDFNEERRLLQTYVFPKVKDYCSGKGYTFQPIDLRWGVSNEAQLDQKTLELCINEVHASKLQPHPNFLIMAGDRYGWVPCPYAIEEEEFKAIKKQVKATDEPLTIEYKEYKVKDSNACETGDKGSFDEQDNNKIFKPNDSQITKIELLEKWYKLDENQIPPSYILQERVNNEHGCYESYQYWEAEENALREIIQTAVNESDLSDEIKYKYFDSATEQETVDGILNYKGLTKFQESELGGDNKDVQLEDKLNVYSYIRTIDESNSDPESISSFIVDDEDRVKANEFKDKIRDSIGAGNIREVKEASIGNFCKVGEDDKVDSGNCKTRGLNYEYKAIGSKGDIKSESQSIFVTEMISFLRRSIDSFHSLYNEQNATELDEQIESQKLFKQTKSSGFVGREDDLKAIQDYIDGNSDAYNNEQAFVVYGPSGMGKSALMAKAIEQTDDNQKDKKVVYRFVGSKADLSTSINVVLSILKELGLNSDELKIQTIRDSAGRDREEELEEYFYRLQQHFLAIKEEVIIFIDAVDQFTNTGALNDGHEFKWLPYKLPSNLKIVISALDDEKYKVASGYLKLLKTRVHGQGNLHELKPFTNSQSQTMLCNILERSGRKLTKEQEAYVLKQPDANQPLYLFVAAQELIHWKSTDITKVYQSADDGQDLAPTQREIIDEYIRNLTEIYHHDDELVQRVFSYLHLTGGLSESVLLEVLSADHDFIKKIAPDTYHANTTKTLPVVIWARLHSHIKPFLKMENKQGRDTMGFFHREFSKSIDANKNTKKIHEDLIALIFKLMQNDHNQGFLANMYMEYYIELVNSFIEDLDSTSRDDYLHHCGESIANIGNAGFLIELWQSIKWKVKFLQKNLDFNTSLGYMHIAMAFTENLHKQDLLFGSELYADSLIIIATSYKNIPDSLGLAIYYEESALMVFRDLYEQDPDDLRDRYVDGLLNLSNSYFKDGRVEKSIDLSKTALTIKGGNFETLLRLASYTLSQGDLKEGLKNAQKAYDIAKENKEDEDRYARACYTLSVANNMNKNPDNALEYGLLAWEIRKKQYEYEQDSEDFAENYSTSLINLSRIFSKAKHHNIAIELLEESLSIAEELANKDPRYKVNVQRIMVSGISIHNAHVADSKE